MRNFWLKFTSLGIVTVTFTFGCSPVYYSPNSQNVPLLSHKGEYNVGVSGSEKLLEFQGSVSPDNHLGLQLNGSWYIPEKTDSGNRGAGYFTDAGVGYYVAFGPNDILVFETYAIGGIGGVRNTFANRPNNTATGSLYSNVGRYGIQPVFGVKWKYVDAAISSRFVGLSYFNTSGGLVYENISQVNYINQNRHGFLIEPALTVRAGVDFLKAQIQLGGSFNITNPGFHQRNSMLTVGLVFSTNRYRNIFAKKS
jgi:hypothetical protein